MHISAFDYQLPEHLIARYPQKERSDSRLMQVQPRQKNISHHSFKALSELLEAGDLLVLNNTKVIKARLYGQKPTGGKVEFLVERIRSSDEALVHAEASKALKVGQSVLLENGDRLICMARTDALFVMKLESALSFWQLLEQVGHVPLPPYMARDDEQLDLERYQTVFAKYDGSVAAPTAGLHFDEALFAALKKQGIQFAEVTLHVGAGTFQPVRVENINEHVMHSEWLEVSEEAVSAIKATKAKGKRVIAVGTTAVRSLESAARSGELKPYTGETDIFIYPGFEFKVVDGMVTNFHLPKSSLLMLVGAFAGVETIQHAYQSAIEAQYQFYSYGDAMLLMGESNAV